MQGQAGRRRGFLKREWLSLFCLSVECEGGCYNGSPNSGVIQAAADVPLMVNREPARMGTVERVEVV